MKPRLRVFPAWLEVASLENDFEGPVFRRHPRLRELKMRLTRAGAAVAALSGSGSTVFGVFATERAAKTAARQLNGPRVDVLVSRFRPRRSR